MAEKLVRVFLRRSCGPRGGALYGPGWANVPESFARTLGLAPELVQTDDVGRPLTDTVAASVGGAARASGTGDAALTTIPHPEREDTDEGALVETDATTTSPLDRTAAAIADAAESDERTGGKLQAETDVHVDESHELTAQPGNTTAASTDSASTDSDKPATKAALRAYGDADALRALAKRKSVDVDDDATKAELVDSLYEAEVTL